jgi:hypothetical protein
MFEMYCSTFAFLRPSHKRTLPRRCGCQVRIHKWERGDGIDDRSDLFVARVELKRRECHHATVWPQYGPQTMTEARRRIND